MNYIDWIGFLGVLLILLAYIFNVTGKLKSTDLIFIILNLLGAGLACLASILLKYLPFVILEGVWSLVSLVAFINYLKKTT